MSDNTLLSRVEEQLQKQDSVYGWKLAEEMGEDVGDVYDVLTKLVEDDRAEQTSEGYELNFDPFTLQVKADLEDLAVAEAEWDYEWDYSHSRSEILASMLPNFDIESKCTGGYQGTYVFRLDGPEYVWLLRDSYGSCSYCDGLINNGNPYGYGVSMLRNAYAFESEDDAQRFLEAVDNWRWERVKGLALKLFK